MQSFIARHQGLLHSVLLDSSYPVRDLDPWYVSSGTVARYALDAVCARDPSCPAGSAVGAPRRAARAAARGAADRDASRAADGGRRRVRFDDPRDRRPRPGRRLRGARSTASSTRRCGRRWPATRAPLARMVAESRRFVHSGGGDPADYSNGLYWAVACADYPQLFSMSSPPAVRRAPARGGAAAPPAGRVRPVHRERVGDGRQLHPAVHGLPRLAAPAQGRARRAGRPRGRCRRRSRC